MEYFEESGAAVARLSWEKLGSSPTPTLVSPASRAIVDNQDAGFVRGGTASGWGSATEGYQGHLY